MLKTTKDKLALSLLSIIVPILMLSNLSLGADHAFQNVTAPTSQEKLAPLSFTLKQAVDHALANNPDLQIAIERIGHAEAQLGIALSAFYPQITARASYEHSGQCKS